MKQVELKINNRVSVNEPISVFNYQVREIRKNGVLLNFFKTIENTEYVVETEVEIPFDKLVPISLTDEILLKCGFKFNDSLNAWEISSLNSLIYKNNGSNYHDTKPDGLFYICFEEFASYDYPILYLHQLQNLYFALTNKEIEIKLLP